MDPTKNKKSNDCNDLDQEAQKIIRDQVESVITSRGIDWQRFEAVKLREEKCGPPRYATSEIFDKLEESGVLSLRQGYGAYALQAGSLINIGPKRNIFSKYGFSDLAELKRYVEACYGDAQYEIVSVRQENIIPI